MQRVALLPPRAPLYLGLLALVTLAGLALWKRRFPFPFSRRGVIRQVVPFHATDLRGNPVFVFPGARRPSLILFFCLCQDCLSLARQFRESQRAAWADTIELLAIIRADQPHAVSFQQMTEFPGILLVDPSGIIHQQYRVGPCPNASLVNQNDAVAFDRSRAITMPQLARELDTRLMAR